MRNRILSVILAGFALSAALGTAGCGNKSNNNIFLPPTPPGVKFNYPSSVVAINVSGTETDLYVADTTHHAIRMVKIDTISGVKVSTFAGKAGESGKADDTDGILDVRLSRFYYPCSITTDGLYLYVADTYNNTIRKITISNGNVETLAGKAGSGVWPSDRYKDDPTGTKALFYRPFGITYDSVNNKLYVADTGNHVIRSVDLASPVSPVDTLAGKAGTSGAADLTGTAATFWSPIGVATDGTYVYVGDTDNHKIRKINISTKEVTTVTGSPNAAGTAGYNDKALVVTLAKALFNKPAGLALVGTNLYVADSYNHTIRLVDLNLGQVSTTAGIPTEFYHTSELTDYDTRFRFPQAISTLDGTTFYVADTYGHILRKLVPADTVPLTVLAGLPLVAGYEDSP